MKPAQTTTGHAAAPTTGPVRRIVFAVGERYSDHARLAWAWTKQNLLTPSTELTLLKVVPTKQTTDAYVEKVETAPFETARMWMLPAHGAEDPGMAQDATHYKHTTAVEVMGPGSVDSLILRFMHNLNDEALATHHRRPDLFVIGSRTQRHLDRPVIGAIANNIIHHADFPVLLVRSSVAAHALESPHEQRPRTVLIALDGSPESESICSWARKHVLLRRDAVVLIHAADPLSAAKPEAAMNKQAKELERCKGILQAAGEYSSVTAAAIDVTHDLRDALVGFIDCQQPPIDLLVMASAKRRVTAHKVLGSTTSYAAKFAQCPIAIVPIEILVKKQHA